MFSLSEEFSNDRSRVWSDALAASQHGWDQGRFVSPLTHFVSNLGVLITNETSRVFQIDIITAYSIWRSLLMVLTGLVVIALTSQLLRAKGAFPGEKRLAVMSLIGVLFPAAMVLNRGSASGRLSIWSYSIVFLLVLTALTTLAKLVRLQATRSGRAPVLLAIGLVGLLMGTSYELSQILGPIGAIVILLSTAVPPTEDTLPRPELWRRFEKMVKAAMRSGALFTYLSTYVMSTLFIRLNGIAKCDVGCYQPADIKVSQFSVSALTANVLSSLPPFNWRQGLIHNPPWDSIPAFKYALAGVFLIILPISLAIIRMLSKCTRSDLKKIGLLLATLGMSIAILISVGMASSRAVLEAGNPFERLGMGNRDTLMMNTGYSLLFSGALLMALGFITQRPRVFQGVTTSTMSLILSALFAITFTSNIVSTDQILDYPGVFLQAKFAAEVNEPDRTLEGYERRCSLVKQKIRDYPEWEGHDRILVYGLNLRMLGRIGGPFCEIPIDQLFAEYPLK